MHTFFQVTHRTHDVAAAQAFYRAVLGERPLEVVKLHEQAVARGARPHWLCFIEVEEVKAAAAAFTARGATALGPPWINPQGLEAATLRDPGGAVLALGKPGKATPRHDVGARWYHLSSADGDQARSDYGALFGWTFAPPRSLGELGSIHPFAVTPGGPLVGSVSTLRPGVHPHWLVQFEVEDFDRAVAEVKARGGLVLAPVTLPDGVRVAVCDDPQGAAFGVRGAR